MTCPAEGRDHLQQIWSKDFVIAANPHAAGPRLLRYQRTEAAAGLGEWTFYLWSDSVRSITISSMEFLFITCTSFRLAAMSYRAWSCEGYLPNATFIESSCPLGKSTPVPRSNPSSLVKSLFLTGSTRINRISSLRKGRGRQRISRGTKSRHSGKGI